MRGRLTGEDEGGEWRERLLGGSTPTGSRPVAASVMLRLSRWMEVELAADDMTLLRGADVKIDAKRGSN